ncbi:hypothetical protein SUGI_0784910 [Cryptomeria japonica]|nr:hypothetical protein SUGI_0784910 [Cryptomeria japonica]
MRIGPLSPAILKHLRKTKQNQRKKKADEMTWHMSAQNMREQQVLVWLHSGPVADVPRVSPTGVLTPFWLTRSAGRMASEGGSVKNSAECRKKKDNPTRCSITAIIEGACCKAFLSQGLEGGRSEEREEGWDRRRSL